MVVKFRSTKLVPRERGQEFGFAHRTQIQSNIETYQHLFLHFGGNANQVFEFGQMALTTIAEFAPPLFEEILGLADGTNVDPALIGMLNARTEILAILKAKLNGECSVVVHVPARGSPPQSVQTWDWFYRLRNGWLVWEIPLADGTVTKTMTEYGIVGKSGLNTRGLGLLFTILHHKMDGQKMGVPVHVAARWALDNSQNIASAAQMLAQAQVSASSSINLVSYQDETAAAITVELCPHGSDFVLPNESGYIIHTNHFLADRLKHGDTEPRIHPDTLLRQSYLWQQMQHVRAPSSADIIAVMASHSGGDGAVCCHHNPQASPYDQIETLATIALHLESGELEVTAGGPCLVKPK